jgi:hypothetical protein
MGHRRLWRGGAHADLLPVLYFALRTIAHANNRSSVMGKYSEPRPSVSECTLFVIWDLIEAERRKGGEKAATALAQKALRAIQPEEETTKL